MDEYQDQSTNVQVIAGAALVSAVLAGIALLISRRKQKEPTATERVEEAAEAAVSQARSAGRRLLREVPAASHELERVGKDARRFFDRRGRAGQEVAHEVEARARRFGKQAQHTGDEAASTAQMIAAQAAAAAVERAERALEAGASLADAAREQAPAVAHRVGDEVVPSLRDVAAHAASTALALWHEARERAGDVSHVDLRDPAQHARHLAEVGGELARGTTATVAERAAELSRRAAETTEHTVERARDASKRTADIATHRAKVASKRTAEATVETGKNTGALLFWAGAAAGLIGYALLSPERRQQIAEGIMAAWAQVQELIQDFQGYDEEF